MTDENPAYDKPVCTTSMPKEKLDSLALKKALKPKKIVPFNHKVPLSNTIKQKKTGLILEDSSSGVSTNSNKLHVFEIGSAVDDLEGLPLVVRKDRLVQEIENSLAEIEDHYSNTSKLEEERTAVEMERNSLLKDIEETITEIQNHVLNSSELEHEKGGLKEECDGLRYQVDQLKNVLGGSTGFENGSNDDELTEQTLALKAEINSLTSENEKLKTKVKDVEVGELPPDMSRELELLHDENSNLQKLLQMAEESEENMAKKLKSFEAKLTEIQKQNDELKNENKRLTTEKEQLELDQEDLEEELYSLQTRLKKSRDQNQNDLMLKESKEEFAKAQRKCATLEKENGVLNTKIQQLEKEIKLQHQQQEEKAAAKKTLENGQQLKSALEKLNKENSSLHESLDKAETEIENLQHELKKERDEKEKLRAASSENGKKKKIKKEKERESGGNKDSEAGRSDEVEAFKKEIYNLKSECEALSETIARTANEKRKLVNDVEELKEDKSKLESKVQELESVVSELMKVKSENEELKEQYSSLRVFHDDLAQKLEVTKKSNSEKDENLKKTQSEKDAMKQRCVEVEETTEKLQKELKSLHHDVTVKTDELKTLKINHDKQKKEFSTKNEVESKERENLQHEIREMSEKLKSKDEEMDSVVKALSAKGPELQNLRITVDEMRKELKLTKSSLRESEQTKLIFEKSAQKAEKTVEELQKSSAVLNDLAMEKSLELSRTKRTLEKKVEKLTKENAEMRKKFGLEVPPGSTTPIRLSPVIVQMQNISSDEANLEHLSRPSDRARNDGTKRQSREYSPSSHGITTNGGRRHNMDYSPSSRGITANGLISDVTLRRSSVNGDAPSDRQIRESEYGKQNRSKEVVSTHASSSEYRVIASEVSSPPVKRESTSSVIHVASTLLDHSPIIAKRDFSFDQIRDEEWKTNGRRLEERRQNVKERSTDSTNVQESNEAAFQVVGYRKDSGNMYEHWV